MDKFLLRERHCATTYLVEVDIETLELEVVVSAVSALAVDACTKRETKESVPGPPNEPFQVVNVPCSSVMVSL